MIGRLQVGMVALMGLGGVWGMAGPVPWAFEPPRDGFRPEALLDLRYLNEGEAGMNGFVSVNGEGEFVLGDGRPARFWCVNTGVARRVPFEARPRWSREAPDLAYHARFLAKRGVNMVRCHAHINPAFPKEGPVPGLGEVNRGEIDWIWRTVAAMKKEGIYTTISPYWANTMRSDDEAWGTDWEGEHHGLLFFEEKLQEAYKGWLRELFAVENPHTGIPLARDPAVGLIQLQNEDSLLFWTVNRLKGGPKERLGRKFGSWVEGKYGSIEAGLKAWGGRPMAGDRVEEGVLDFRNIYDMTGKAGENVRRSKRLDDQLQFWSETMHAFNREMARFLREELGCRQPINAGNWKTADPVLLNDAERWSYTANEVVATNRYFGGEHKGSRRGWAIVEGDTFTNRSVLTNGTLQFPLNLKHVVGHPMMVTESSWVFPNQYAAEGPMLVAAYGALTGFDGFYWFATGTDGWTPPQSANGFFPSQQKWIFATPDVLGQFPAAALMYRTGMVRQGEVVVMERRALADLWARKVPLVAEAGSFDPNRDEGEAAEEGAVLEEVPREAFLVGPVRVEYGANSSESRVMDLSGYVSADRKEIRSVTGELKLETGPGVFTVDTPMAQGAAAFFKNRGKVELADVVIECGNEYAAILVVAMDGKPLKESKKVLVQVGTEARPTGWVQVPEGKGFRVESYGGAPWQVIRGEGRVLVRNGSLVRATLLDANGMADGELAVERVEGGVRVALPERHLYAVLEGE